MKSVTSTPTTFSLNVTVHVTLSALVGSPPTLVIARTRGAVVSIGEVVTAVPTPAPGSPEHDPVATATSEYLEVPSRSMS
jgi:hypothetical protein